MTLGVVSPATICRACRVQLRLQLRQAQRRTFHAPTTLRGQPHFRIEPRGLGDFYNDLLASPLPKSAKATTAEESLPEWVASGGRKDIEERAKKLFGTIEGSGYQRTTSETPDSTWHTINGVPVPPRPGEPDNCCMSGCVHCVWDDYRDDVEQWAHRLREAQARGQGRGMDAPPKIAMNRPEVSAASGSMDDDGGGSEALWNAPSSSADANELFAEIPVGIREFMAAEKRIRERKRARKSA